MADEFRHYPDCSNELIGIGPLDTLPLPATVLEGAVLGWEVMNDIKMTAKMGDCHAHQDTVRQVQGRACGRSGAAVAQQRCGIMSENSKKGTRHGEMSHCRNC